MENQPPPSDYVLPFRALKLGHIPYLVYGLGLSALCLYGISFVENFLQSYATVIATEYKLSKLVVTRIQLWIWLLCWIFSLPFFITAWCVPVRVLWIRGKPAFSEMLELTVGSLQRVTATLYLVFRRSGYALLVALALYVFHQSVIAKSSNPKMLQMFLVIAAVIVLLVLIRGLVLFLASFLVVCGQISPIEALRNAPMVYRGKSPKMISEIIVGFAVVAGAHFLIHHDTWTFTFNLHDKIVAGIVAWYVITLLAFNSMSSIAAYLHGEGASQR